MPDHFHLLITPIVTLERAMQFIKGGIFLSREARTRIRAWDLAAELPRPAGKGCQGVLRVPWIYSPEPREEDTRANCWGIRVQLRVVWIWVGWSSWKSEASWGGCL